MAYDRISNHSIQAIAGMNLAKKGNVRAGLRIIGWGRASPADRPVGGALLPDRGGVRLELLLPAPLLLLCSASAAFAQINIDVGKITCQQFAQAKTVAAPIAAAWLSGYYYGRAGNPSIDLHQLQEQVDNLIYYCWQEKNFELPVMQAIEQSLAR
jgi:acid stress chaperone HdeB